ncbi:CD225/dispanin family protein [Halostreptopolyspora alba]|uniref:CD225/dispanin family protein n=1 Tax=Halostreptopolyspora alba TaxID=2487137 RepID=A0A3N0EF52_9ACTN|nr:CD225/dispanin family protein [Nocardiopsaceae bacterium YIM 96095]
MSYGPPPPPPGGYGPPPPPQGGAGPQAGPAPDNWLVPAILATIFCCWPLGIPAILAAAKVNEYWNLGDHAGAHEQSSKAKKFTIIAAISAVVVWILIGLLYFLMFAAMFSAAGSASYNTY